MNKNRGKWRNRSTGRRFVHILFNDESNAFDEPGSGLKTGWKIRN